jgi:hypothetical protein
MRRCPPRWYGERVAPDLGVVGSMNPLGCLMTSALVFRVQRRSSPRVQPSIRSRRHKARLGRHVCRLHAGPLLAMAVLILQDVDAASGVVVETIAAACRRPNLDPIGTRSRTALATSVYRRCLGVLAARERFGPSPDLTAGIGSAGIGPPLGWLTNQQRCAMALILYGRHGLHRAARTLSIAPESLLQQLRDLLTSMTDFADTPTRTSTMDSRPRLLPRQRQWL